MHVIKFPRELLIRHTIHANELPDTGLIVTCVDTAYSTKTWADYTVIITALIYGGRFFVIDMKRGRYNEFELPKMIADTAAQWKPKRICIEETGAIKYIAREVYREMDKLKYRCPIELVPLGKGDKKVNSKQKKAGPLLRFLGMDRFKFINTCPQLDELYNELEKFGTAGSTHDDIVDALALRAKHRLEPRPEDEVLVRPNVLPRQEREVEPAGQIKFVGDGVSRGITPADYAVDTFRCR
jgi:phage terminase large subunit-like protein